MPPERIDVSVHFAAENAGTLVGAVDVLLVDLEKSHGFLANFAKVLHDLSFVRLTTVLVGLLLKRQWQERNLF